jgi:hypothetical protein
VLMWRSWRSSFLLELTGDGCLDGRLIGSPWGRSFAPWSVSSPVLKVYR